MKLTEEMLFSTLSVYERRAHQTDWAARKILDEVDGYPLEEEFSSKTHRREVFRQMLLKWLRHGEKKPGGASLSPKERRVINRIIELIMSGE